MTHHHRHAALTPLRAEDYQEPDDDARARAEAAAPAVARDLDDGFDRLRDDVEIAALVALLASSFYAEVYRVLGIVHLDQAVLPALKRLERLAEATAEAAMAGVPARAAPAPALAPGLRYAPSARLTPAVIPLTYDPRDQVTLEGQQGAREELVRMLRSSAGKTVHAVLRDGVARRARPEELARDLRDTLGITEREARAVANFRRLLEEGDRAALNRVLRDKRFDASVRRAIEGDKSLSPEKIDRMVARYAERYRMHRARTIATTETLRAANRGRADAWRQYGERATNREVRRFWLTAADERVCPVCRAIPGMNPSGVAMGEPYATPDGDTDMPPIHANCRCTERYEVTE